MYQSFVYLEVRILLAPVSYVFLKKNENIQINPNVLASCSALAQALGCNILDSAEVEHLTGKLPAESASKISGYSLRIAEAGAMNIMFHMRPKKIAIQEMRIEEDAGRLTHSEGKTHLDFTWLGAPSLRITTAASFELGEEVEVFLNEIRRLVQYLHLDNSETGEGGIRCNSFVALSVFPKKPEYYVKLRNLNSFNFARKAVNSEITRQEKDLALGKRIVNESRIWNEKKNCTESYQLRNTEVSRFESLIPPFFIDLKTQRRSLSDNDLACIEIPEQRRLRLKTQYGLSKLQTEFLCDDKDCADYFEAAVAAGADPFVAEQWMKLDFARLMKTVNADYSDVLLSPDKFSFIIKILVSGRINTTIARHLMKSVMETGKNPEEIILEENISLLADDDELLPFVKKVIKENPGSAQKLSSGKMAPLEFLTGEIMKKTKGRADPNKVKSLIKKELEISIIYVISMGGAMSSVRSESGSIIGGDSSILKKIIHKSEPEIPVQFVSIGNFLSDEIEPSDWAVLIHEVAEKIAAGTANGIIITHGMDTLSYSAALMFWLFSDASVPIVLTASPSLTSESSDTADNLLLSVHTVCREKKGVYVAFGGKILSPLNLRFERPTQDGFRNWNLNKPVFTESGVIAEQFVDIKETDVSVLTTLLNDAASKMIIFRVYPGFNSSCFLKMTENIKTVFLELYETGTGNMRSGDFSLRPLLVQGRKRGIHFYCTSQQESLVNFSQYITETRVWREGAIAMGMLSRESAVALYFACSLIADSDEEMNILMESYAENYGE